MNNGERFEMAYNRIHSYMKEKDPKYQNDSGFADFKTLLRRSTNPVIKNIRNNSRLLKFHDLRNVMVHEKGNNGLEYIATPHSSIVEEIEKFAEELTSPRSAESICTKEMAIIQSEDNIKTALDLMKNEGKGEYSQIPVYNENHFVALLTDGGISRWIAQAFDDDGLLMENVTIKQVIRYESTDNVAFIGRHESVYKVKELFENRISNNQLNLQAVIVTENGKPHEKGLGIITAWDIVGIEI